MKKKYKEQDRVRDKDYYQKNKTHVKVRQKKYYENHKEEKYQYNQRFNVIERRLELRSSDEHKKKAREYQKGYGLGWHERFKEAFGVAYSTYTKQKNKGIDRIERTSHGRIIYPNDEL